MRIIFKQQRSDAEAEREQVRIDNQRMVLELMNEIRALQHQGAPMNDADETRRHLRRSSSRGHLDGAANATSSSPSSGMAIRNGSAPTSAVSERMQQMSGSAFDHGERDHSHRRRQKRAGRRASTGAGGG